MQTADAWRLIFEKWPAAIPREGLLITNWNETIDFCDFACAGPLVMVDRPRPDASGARKVIVPYENIRGVKSRSPDDLKTFDVMGFTQPRS